MLWAVKIRLHEDPEPTEWMKWGTLLEPFVCQEYSKATGFKLQSYGKYFIFRNPDSPLMLATLDRGIDRLRGDQEIPEGLPNPVGGEGILEAKTTNYFAGKDWQHGKSPLYYECQFQHALETTGRKWGSIAVLIGGQRLEIRHYVKNERFGAHLREKVEEFWGEHIVKDIPPEADGSNSTKEAIRRLYPNDTGESVQLPPESISWHEDLQALKKRMKKDGDDRQELENKLKLAIGDASYAYLPMEDAEHCYQCSTVERAESVQRACSYRQLRVVKNKQAKGRPSAMEAV